jgi:hypothetical protein
VGTLAGDGEVPLSLVAFEIIQNNMWLYINEREDFRMRVGENGVCAANIEVIAVSETYEVPACVRFCI